jgi:hypothetical protein
VGHEGGLSVAPGASVMTASDEDTDFEEDDSSFEDGERPNRGDSRAREPAPRDYFERSELVRIVEELPWGKVAFVVVIAVVNVCVLAVHERSSFKFSWSPAILFPWARAKTVILGGALARPPVSLRRPVPTPYLQTLGLLDHLAPVVSARDATLTPSAFDPTGQSALDIATYREDRRGGVFVTRGIHPRPRERTKPRPPALDGWGRPFIFRCPGPVHPRGWDLYSMGPNGIDELGCGDDIVSGESGP